MFSKILHANDGSEHAFRAFAMALAMAKQNNSDLHMVSVEEIDFMPEYLEEVSRGDGNGRAAFSQSRATRALNGQGKSCRAPYPCYRRASGARHRRTCQGAQGRTAGHRCNRPFGGLRTPDRQPRRSNCTARALSGPG